MNIGLIIAGGVGARMNVTTPKQFIAVKGKPVLIYTLEAFQNNAAIDEIVVVCLHGWDDVVWKYANKYNISKLKWIAPGGETGMESLRNGMLLLKEKYSGDDIVVIHDAVRPLVSDNIINANIAGVIRNGNAITCIPCSEALLYSEDCFTSEKEVNRDTILRTQTPQSLYLSKFIWAHEEAVKRGITSAVATCSLLTLLGEKVYAVPGETMNFKITTKDDIALMEAYLFQQEQLRIIGDGD